MNISLVNWSLIRQNKKNLMKVYYMYLWFSFISLNPPPLVLPSDLSFYLLLQLASTSALRLHRSLPRAYVGHLYVAWDTLVLDYN